MTRLTFVLNSLIDQAMAKSRTRNVTGISGFGKLLV